MSITIDFIHDEWEKDGVIDVINLSNESSRTPKLHNKYYHLYIREALLLKKMRSDYKQLVLLKTEYLSGLLDADELKKHGWQPRTLKILRADFQIHLDADQEIINQSLKIGLVEEKVNYLESIIKEIQRRSFHIKSILDFERFKSGSI